MAKDNHNIGSFVWLDGKWLDYSSASIPLLGHSLHYGTAAWEGIRSYTSAAKEPLLFRAQDHFERLFYSMRLVGFQQPAYSINELCTRAWELVQKNGFGDAYVRPIAFGDDRIFGMKMPPPFPARLAITTWKWDGYFAAQEGIASGLKVKIVSIRRLPQDSGLNRAKLSGPYLFSVLARQEANQAGFDEALLLDPQGFIAEGSGENVFIVRQGQLLTPEDGYVLPGITRKTVIQLAHDRRIPFAFARLTRADLYTADEVFFTGTAAEIKAVLAVDQYPIGQGKTGEITQQLQKDYGALVRGEKTDYSDWTFPKAA